MPARAGLLFLRPALKSHSDEVMRGNAVTASNNSYFFYSRPTLIPLQNIFPDDKKPLDFILVFKYHNIEKR